MRLRLFARAPAALAGSLCRELEACGARSIRSRGAGVEFQGSLETAYRACLWSRVASRILLELARFPAIDGDTLYAGARRIAWHEHLDPQRTFAVSCTSHGARIAHTRYAALRVKDAVADHFTARLGRRPSVDPRSPDVRLDLHLRGGEARLALDLSGDGLHKRGYRTEAGPAPLRETLACGMLYFGDWPARARRARPFVDPVCGSGTLAIEAALMAGDVAPGLTRERYGFEGWRGHRPEIWGRLVDEARRRARAGLARLPPVLGRDRDPVAVDLARRNAERAGLAGRVRFEVARLECASPALAGPGLVACNPPFGRRLDDGRSREEWARLLARAYPGWHVVVLEPAARDPGQGAQRALEVRNGALACRIRAFDAAPAASPSPVVDASAFANRLAKRISHLERWARRADVRCYRVYDADVPEFAIAVDRYEGGEPWLHVSEYAAPATIDPALAEARLEAAIETLAERTGIPPARIVVKQRRRQRRGAQYQRASLQTPPLEVMEHGCRLLVNLRDYVDTGLFLDHRPLRRWIQERAAGLRFLNLFSYTAAASVHAARGGADATLSVDLSPVYCRWARRNLELNGFGPPQHVCIEADCIAWLDTADPHEVFDLVLLDPPTFSNSKRAASTLDVQRDHAALIRAAARRLAPGGVLVFSCNRRGFRLDEQALAGLRVEDVTAGTLDEDFTRRPPPHRCYHIRPAANVAGSA